MIASAANGFANTNMSDCSGVPHTFHAEYSTASQQNQVPWAALEGGVLMQQEIGHAEVCNSVSNQDPFTFTGGNQTFSDPKDFDTCDGGTEGPKATGEGPCDPQTGICQNADDPGTERAGGVPDQRLDQRCAVRVRRWLVLPEGHPHGHDQRLAGDRGVGHEHLPRQPVPER